jgi:hypothetical protein
MNCFLMENSLIGISTHVKPVKPPSMYSKQSTARSIGKKIALMATLLIGCLLVYPVFGRANPVVRGLSPAYPTDTTISPKDLKAYEGYYKFQFEKGTDSYIHLTATAKGLVLKQMWDGKEIAFTAQSALDFVDDQGHFPLKFTKEHGKFTQVLAFNRDLWTRANDYKPPVSK